MVNPISKYFALGTVIAVIILILVKFGSRGLFESHPSQPVASLTLTEIQAKNSETINSIPTGQASSVDNEKAEIKAAVDEHFRGLNAKDLAVAMSIIDKSNPYGYKQTRDLVQKIFYTYDLNYELNAFEIIEMSESYAKVRTVQTTTKIAGPAFKDNILVSTHIFRKVNGQWKIFSTELKEIKYLN